MGDNHTNGNGSNLLQQKLNDPHTVDVLARLLDRIDALEQTVNRLADVVEQAPAFTAMMGDMVDETYRSAAARGVDLEERAQNALVLAEKLTAPETTAQLEQLLALADQAPGMVAMVGDMVDETYRSAAANGVDMEARLGNALQVAEKLTAPDTVAKLNQLLELSDQAPGFIAMMGDMVDETYRSAAARGVDIEQRLQAGLAVAERLTAPETVQNLNQLLDLADQAPGMAAMIGDMVDDTYRSAAARGVDIEQRLQAGLAVAERLTAPETVQNLNQLLDLADQAPGMAAMIGDMVDDTYRSAAARGVDIEQRLQTGLVMAERLTAPETVQNLNQLLDLADQAPGMAAMIGDMVDEAYRNAAKNGLDLEQLVRRGSSAVGKIAEAANSDEFDALMNSGALAPDTLAVIGATGKALANASKKPVEPVGLFGLLSMLRDPDTQRALGFLANVGQELGKQL